MVKDNTFITWKTVLLFEEQNILIGILAYLKHFHVFSFFIMPTEVSVSLHCDMIVEFDIMKYNHHLLGNKLYQTVAA